MATTMAYGRQNAFTRFPKHPYISLLLFSALFFGVSKGYAVPQISERRRFPVIDVQPGGRMLIDSKQSPSAHMTENFDPSTSRREPPRSLHHHEDPPRNSRSLHDMLIPLPKNQTQNVGAVSRDRTTGTFSRRILSSEEVSEGGEAHVLENAQNEGVSVDAVEEEDSYEEGEEDDEDDEVEEEQVEHAEEEYVGERENTSTNREKVSSKENEMVYRERPTIQSIQEISETIRTAADALPVSASHDDTAVEGVSHEENTDKASKSEKENSNTKERSSSPGGFRGIPGGEVDGTNITHISYMIYKIVKTYEIKTVLDIPCRNNLNWFPELLHQIDFEVIGFKYICVDDGADRDANLHSHFSEAGNPEFLSIPPTESFNLPKSDLIFSYDGPQQWGVRKTWGFFTGLRKVRPKYIIVTNNPGQMNSDKGSTLNLRKQPFHFSQAMRVISNIHTGGKPKQLVFYETEHIREGF